VPASPLFSAQVQGGIRVIISTFLTNIFTYFPKGLEIKNKLIHQRLRGNIKPPPKFKAPPRLYIWLKFSRTLRGGFIFGDGLSKKKYGPQNTRLFTI